MYLDVFDEGHGQLTAGSRQHEYPVHANIIYF